MTAEQLRKIVDSFPNDSRRHHHKLIRELAQEALQLQFQNFMLKAEVDASRKIIREKSRPAQLEPCEEDAA